MPFDMKDFHSLALRTESLPNEEILRRLVRTYPMYSEQITEEVHIGGFLDHIKKYVFYLSEDQTVEKEIPPVWPTGDKKERIHQLARMLHGLIGIGTEYGELGEEIVDYIEGRKPELDIAHIAEECFDILWYTNLILACIAMDIPLVAEKGIAKLKERYPKKFTAEDALNRDTTKEMQAFNASNEELMS